MILKKSDCIDCCVNMSKVEFELLTDTMNEVRNGINNIDVESVLSTSLDDAREIHYKFLNRYKEIVGTDVDFYLDRNELFVLQKAIVAVIRDFNKYNEYHVRLGVEFYEYLDLLADLNDIIEKCCTLD